MDVAVIGGGFAGLGAAWELVNHGARVTLYESGEEPGGRVRSDELGGHIVDASLQLFGSSYTTLFGMLRASNAAHELVRAPGRDAVRRDGRIHTVTYGSMSSMLASGTLSTRLKLRLGTKYLPYLARHARGLDANALASAVGTALDGESAAAFGRRELGDEFVDYLVHPLLAAYYGTPADEASAALLHALAVAGMDVSVYAAVRGAGTVARSIVLALESKGATMRMATMVQNVSVTGSGARVEYDGGVAEHEAVVVAVPAPAARALLPEQPALGAWLGQVRMRPTVTLALALDQRVAADYFGLSFPASDALGAAISAVCVQRNKRPTAAVPPGDALVVIPSPAAAERLTHADASGVVDALLPPLDAVYPGLAQRVVHARTYRFDYGHTVFGTGHLRHLAGVSKLALPRRLALAGDYLHAPTAEGAARSGVAAARALLERGA